MKAEKILKELQDCETRHIIFNLHNKFTLEDFAEALQQAREMEIALTWMTKNMKWKEDDIRQNLQDETEGGYSDELLGVLELLEKIRNNK